MLDALNTHLKLAASPETLAAITEAYGLFEDYELDNPDTPYLDLLMTADNADLGETVEKIQLLTQEFQDWILVQMQVVLADAATVQQGNLILRTLKQIETTELNGEIVTLCDETADASEILCEILAVVSGEPVENFYPVIESVGPSLILKIRTTVMSEAQAHDVHPIDTEGAAVLISRLVRFRNFCQADPTVPENEAEAEQLLVYDLILQGDNIRLPFQHYYDVLMPQMANLTPKGIARNLYGASLISSDASDNPRPLITEELNTTFTSVDTITPIMTALEGYILGFNASETSGITRA